MEECFSFRQPTHPHPHHAYPHHAHPYDCPKWQRVRTEPSPLREQIEDKLQSTRKTFDTVPNNQIGYFEVSLADLVETKQPNSRQSTASKSERDRGDSWRIDSRQSSCSKGSGRKEASKVRESSRDRESPKSREASRESVRGRETSKPNKGKQAMADVLNGFLNRLNSMSGSSIAQKDIRELKSHLSRQQTSSAELDKILLSNMANFQQFSSNPLQTSQKLSKMLSTPSHPRLAQLKPLPKLQTRRIERVVTDSTGRQFRITVQRTR